MLSSAGALAAQDGDAPDLARERAAIETFQRFDQRLQDVGWRLATGNARFCERAIPAIGLQLQDTASYGRPALARAALGLEGQFAVQTAARGSPAARSGALPSNRGITALGDTRLSGWPAKPKMDWERLKRAHDLIDASLARDGHLLVGLADGETVRIEPVAACATRFELLGEGKRALADGERVMIGIRFPAFAYEEEVFAGVVAHELAHNLLGHSAWLDANGRNQRNIRLTEREADRLMPWLLANAGYDPLAGQRFMERWGPGNDGGLFRNRSHDGWDERAEFIAAEIPRIQRLMEAHGHADWSRHFRRDVPGGDGARAAPGR
ncbi:hypothetical protein [Erythrobacter sp.]|jgi:hypothetical protein|uniref:hypothetical protein n=1 Tax=Erythrobacter sp. TaxID=1042 RepID=UPI002ECE2E1A|nr:hypothetical protein [Erythrobacter sp.]